MKWGCGGETFSKKFLPREYSSLFKIVVVEGAFAAFDCEEHVVVGFFVEGFVLEGLVHIVGFDSGADVFFGDVVAVGDDVRARDVFVADGGEFDFFAVFTEDADVEREGATIRSRTRLAAVLRVPWTS